MLLIAFLLVILWVFYIARLPRVGGHYIDQFHNRVTIVKLNDLIHIEDSKGNIKIISFKDFRACYYEV